DRSPFVVNAEGTPWRAEGLLRAGISGFGMGGTNAHVILEEAAPMRAPSAPLHAKTVVTLSAKSKAALATMRARRGGADAALGARGRGAHAQRGARASCASERVGGLVDRRAAREARGGRRYARDGRSIGGGGRRR